MDAHPELLDGKIEKPLTDVKVAPYYGCHILRPQEIMNYEDGKHPQSFERLDKKLGAECVEFSAKRKCCGFHAQLAAENYGGNCRQRRKLLATPCPLCQMQLDLYEPGGREAVYSRVELPILHLQQLVGFALGISKEDVSFDRHVSGRNKLNIA